MIKEVVETLNIYYLLKAPYILIRSTFLALDFLAFSFFIINLNIINIKNDSQVNPNVKSQKSMIYRCFPNTIRSTVK
jgi:hypothetical protein